MLLLERVVVDYRFLEQPLQVFLLRHFNGSHQRLQVNNLVVEHVRGVLLDVVFDLLHALIDSFSVVSENLVDCHDVR